MHEKLPRNSGFVLLSAQVALAAVVLNATIH